MQQFNKADNVLSVMQAVSWGMPALAEMVLLGLLGGSCNMPFALLANGKWLKMTL
jgi:porphobilinogen deaminase